MTDYTKPELNTERRICGKVRAVILADACRYCLNRAAESLDGRHMCQLYGRTYPGCSSDGRALTLDPDPEAIQALSTSMGVNHGD